jgi:uncharacterized repeat protein (TIGR04138 family)
MGARRKVQSDQPAPERTRYPACAYDFILEGLNYAVEQIHGPLTPAQAIVAKYMANEEIDLDEVRDRHDEGLLETDVSRAIDEAGGFEMLNRHVSGQDLCWSLRDCAIARWGQMASTVLRTWGVTRTVDFGNMVFDLIAAGRLQRQPHDRIEDFHNVFDFAEAFDRAFQVELG